MNNQRQGTRLPWVIRHLDTFPSVEANGVAYRDLRIPGTMATIDIRRQQRPASGEMPPSEVSSMILTCAGSAEVVIDGETIRLDRNDFLFIEAGVGYRWSCCSGEPWVTLAFQPHRPDARST